MKTYSVLIILFLIISNSLMVFKVYNQKKELAYVYEHSDFKKRKASKLVFDSYSYNFGTVKLNKYYSSSFTFTNTSAKEMRLKNVLTSCGCTATSWSNKPILSGEKGIIRLNYHAGPVGEFNKYIGVLVEGDNRPIQLEISGNVLAR